MSPLGGDSDIEAVRLTTEIDVIHCLLVLFLLLCKDEVDATPEDKAFKATSQNQNC